MEQLENNLCKREKELLKKLYLKLYKQFSNCHVDIFLCGGDVNKNTDRKRISNILSSENYLMIFYPERVFVEYFNLNHTSDYLTLENILAENVDFIFIICESPGSIAELGAFSANEKFRYKIQALLKKEYEKDNSFINLGPVKHLLSYDKSSVQYYNNENLDDICLKLKNKLKKYFKKSKKIKNVCKITGIFYFSCLLLYIFKELTKGKLYLYIKYVSLIIEENKDFSNFDPIYSAAEKLLFNKNFIYAKNRDTFKLTYNGSNFINKLLNIGNSYKQQCIYNDIICDILKYKYYRY